jgi:hypothetical protein
MLRILFRCVFLIGIAYIGSACTTTLIELPVEREIATNRIPALPNIDKPELSSHWQPVSLPLKRKTHYHPVKHKGRAAIKATAKSSASGIEAKLNVDLTTKPLIAFSWYAESLVEGADNTDKAAEDSPLRIVLSFEGDKDTLTGKEQRFHERAKLLTGRELPFATLMYIWENQKPVNSVITNPHTSTIKKIVIASGSEELKKWIAFKRNIAEDYLLAFGKPPGRLTGIALMSDTDNTGTDVTAYYADLSLISN